MSVLLLLSTAFAFDFPPYQDVEDPPELVLTPEEHPIVFVWPCPNTPITFGQDVPPDIATDTYACNGLTVSHRFALQAKHKIDVQLPYWKGAWRAERDARGTDRNVALQEIDDRDWTIRELRRARRRDTARSIGIVAGVAVLAFGGGYVVGVL